MVSITQMAMDWHKIHPMSQSKFWILSRSQSQGITGLPTYFCSNCWFLAIVSFWPFLWQQMSKKKQPLYLQLYQQIRDDIIGENYLYNTKLPSKRTLAAQAGVSTITVEHAYELLCDEGVPPYQLFDIISDAKRESVERNLR